ncbi:hypothetical protein [Fulvivirga sp.]|uniref:hypothetical protein n=1 Tax=Fulvivirga sp. TaxID=1931237 RepID=UPI0032EEF307
MNKRFVLSLTIGLTLTVQVCLGQASNFAIFKSKFSLQDTLYTSIDSSNYDPVNFRLKNCKIIDSKYFSLFSRFSCYENFDTHKHWIQSYKQFNDITAMTILCFGKYGPILHLLTFKDSSLIDEIILESSFVDAGQVEIYTCTGQVGNKFSRSFYTEWETQKEGRWLTISDSTVLTFEISSQGKMDTLNVQNFQKDIEWK